MLQTGIIVGGWDKYEGGKIYGVPLGGTIIEQPFAIGGSFLSYTCALKSHISCYYIPIKHLSRRKTIRDIGNIIDDFGRL